MDKKRIRFSIIGTLLLLVTISWIILFFASSKKEYINLTIETETEKEFYTSKTALDKGVYTLNLQYQTDLDVADVVDVYSESEPDTVRSNTTFLYQGLSEFSYNFWVDRKCDDVVVKITKADGSQLTVNQVAVCKTKLGTARVLVWIWIALLIIGGLLLTDQATFQKDIELRKKVTVSVILIAIALVSSIPMFKEGILTGVDVGFHLLRIEGVKDALTIGQFPVRIQPNWLQGHGYANGFFYSDLFLVVPAIFRSCGYTVTESYKIYQFLINLMTSFIAYYSFSKMTKSKGEKAADCGVALLATLLYSTAIYRIIYLYSVEGVGQYTSLAFYPLVAAGIWRILKGEEKGYISLAFGFSGLIQSHVLSVLLALIFSVLFALIFVKEVISGKRYVEIGKAISLCAGLNLWFILPAIIVSKTMELQVLEGAATQNKIQTWGMSFAQLFTILPEADKVGFLPMDAGTSDEIHYTIGLGFSTVLIVGILLIGMALRHKNVERITRKVGVSLWVLTALSMYMSTYYFPWDGIAERIPMLSSLVATIQYPVRLQSITILLLSCLFIWEYNALNGMLEGKTALIARALLCIITVLGASITSGYFIYSVTTQMGHIYIQDEKCMGNGIIINGEYLPLGTDISQLRYYKFCYNGEEIKISSTLHDMGKVTVNVTETVKDTKVEVPLLYYPGYVAKTTDATGQRYSLDITKGNNNVIQIMVPQGFKGNIGVWYEEPILWRVTEVVSAAVLGWLIHTSYNSNIEKWKRRQ